MGCSPTCTPSRARGYWEIRFSSNVFTAILILRGSPQGPTYPRTRLLAAVTLEAQVEALTLHSALHRRLFDQCLMLLTGFSDITEGDMGVMHIQMNGKKPQLTDTTACGHTLVLRRTSLVFL